MAKKRMIQVWRITKKGNLRMKWKKRKVKKEVRYE